MIKSNSPSRKFMITAIAFFMSGVPSLHAQQKAGDFVFTGGIAGSFTQMGLVTFFSSSSYPYNSGITPWSYPGYVLNGERSIGERFSVGGCVSWQSMGYKFTNVPFPNQPNYYGGPTGPVYSWTDTYDRYNVSVRGLYHLMNDKDWDAYLGVRIGYTWWDRKSSNPDPTYNYSVRDVYSNIFLTPVSIQSVAGIRYFFSDNFGISGEVGIGAPYALMLGVALRFNN